MKNITSVWAETLKYFQQNFTNDFDLWIIHLNYINYKNKILKVSVANPFTRDMILSKFKNKIEEVFSSFMEADQITLEISISEQESIFEQNTINKINESKIIKK